MKKCLTVLLCLVLLLAALPAAVWAEELEENQTLTKEDIAYQEVRKSYLSSLAASEKESFMGYCGLMSSYQLWHMGINDWLVVNDGNKQFDYYSQMEQTTGGYYIKAYPASEFSLEEALNMITRDGSWDAYNLLVGFQKTNTEAGNRYGHCCVINAILDGTVYYAESSPTPMGGAEGNVITCSIAEFANYYADWTTYEGVIHFGNGTYADCCQFYGTDLFVRTRFASNLRSQPCLIGENGCTRLRSLAAGELLRADGFCRDPQGQMYYRITDGAYVGYIAASAVSVVRFNGEDLAIEAVSIPDRMEPGKDPRIGGTVYARQGLVGAVEVLITDTDGQVVLRERQMADGHRWDLAGLNEELALDLLEEGLYRVEVYADAACRFVQGNTVDTAYVRTILMQQTMRVGGNAREAWVLPEEKPAETAYDGWVWKNRTWHYYQAGEACSGWLKDLGITYYLTQDGAVTTGQAEIDGKLYCFSATGAMYTGWLTEEAGVRYLLEDGTAATGWQQIQGARYYFGEDHWLQTEGTVQDGEVSYTIQPDGRAIPVEEKEDKKA